MPSIDTITFAIDAANNQVQKVDTAFFSSYTLNSERQLTRVSIQPSRPSNQVFQKYFP